MHFFRRWTEDSPNPSGPFHASALFTRRLALRLVLSLTPFTAVLIYNAVAGTWSAKSCSLDYALSLARTQGDKQLIGNHGTCYKAVLLMDLPSLVLGLGISAAFILHFVFVDQVRHFRANARENDLYRIGGSENTGETSTSLYRSILPASWFRLVVALFVFVAAFFFYYLAEHNGYLFQSLISTQRALPSSRDVDVQTVTRSWWADYRSHPVGAACWLALGIAGTYVSAVDLFSFNSLRQLTQKSAVSIKENRDTLLDSRDHGLWQLTQLEDLKVFGILVFFIIFTAISYLARSATAVGASTLLLVGILLFVSSLSIGFQIVPIRRKIETLRLDLFTEQIARARRLATEPMPPQSQSSLQKWFADVELHRKLNELRSHVAIAAAHRIADLPNRTFAGRSVNYLVVLVSVYAAIVTLAPAAIV